ncbi:MAG TPA: pseudouridine synthase, partial [Deferrimonas sp.]
AETMKERLQKLIAAAGLASRREAEGWIEAGRVRVNGTVAVLGERADPAEDRVEVDGRPLGGQEEKFYILLNKPTGYVTTLRDPKGRPVVADLVKGIPARLFPVGRLDLNTEGVLILTNDGDLAQHLAHPRHQIDKTYLVRVRGALSAASQQKLARGILLDDGPTAPARVEDVRVVGSHTWFKITIHEGRNRQVRRMCETLGHSVSRLKRIRLAFLDLGDLASGHFRHLTPQEVAQLKKM